jgi:predicted nucleic acid-binding protein
MTTRVFVDTNVLVYARDRTEEKKQSVAALWMGELWASRRGRISVQVLQEYYVTATRKLVPPRDRALVREDVAALHAWSPMAVTLPVLERAWALEERYGFSWWEAQIVSAALLSECTYLLTEDLQDGQVVDGLTILDPFAHEPASILGAGTA